MRSGDAIEIEQQTEGDTVVIQAKGDVDITGSPILRDHIRQAQQTKPARLVIDLEHVPYMDSSGLATLVEAMKNAKPAGTNLVLCAMHEKVRAIFEIARLDQYFTIVPSRGEALSG